MITKLKERKEKRKYETTTLDSSSNICYIKCNTTTTKEATNAREPSFICQSWHKNNNAKKEQFKKEKHMRTSLLSVHFIQKCEINVENTATLEKSRNIILHN